MTLKILIGKPKISDKGKIIDKNPRKGDVIIERKSTQISEPPAK